MEIVHQILKKLSINFGALTSYLLFLFLTLENKYGKDYLEEAFLQYFQPCLPL